MATYIELQKQIETLQREADALKTKERDGVIARMREAIEAYDITAADLGFAGKRGRKAATSKPGRKRKGPARRAAGVAYADGKGNSWGGRGPRPKWLKDALADGAKLEDFAKARAK